MNWWTFQVSCSRGGPAESAKGHQRFCPCGAAASLTGRRATLKPRQYIQFLSPPALVEVVRSRGRPRRVVQATSLHVLLQRKHAHRESQQPIESSKWPHCAAQAYGGSTQTAIEPLTAFLWLLRSSIQSTAASRRLVKSIDWKLLRLGPVTPQQLYWEAAGVGGRPPGVDHPVP